MEFNLGEGRTYAKVFRMNSDRRSQVRQVAVAVTILGALAFLVVGGLVGWRFLPGILGEWIGTMVGVLTTPFFLESSFIAIGFVIVMSLNIWRRQKEGDEFVDLEQFSENDGAMDPEGTKRSSESSLSNGRRG